MSHITASPWPPLVGVDELAPRRLVHQLGQQLARVAVVHAVDRIGVARDIERAPVVGRVAPVHAPAHRRQRLALLGIGEVGMDLVAAVGIGVRRHGVLAACACRSAGRRSQASRVEVNSVSPSSPGSTRAVSTEASAGVFLKDESVCQSALALATSTWRWSGGTISPFCADVGQARIEAAGAERGHLGELERPEGAAVGDLDVVGDRLVAEHQQRMLLEGGAHGLVGLGVAWRRRAC